MVTELQRRSSIMVDVSRQSIFPPILGDYSSKASEATRINTSKSNQFRTSVLNVRPTVEATIQREDAPKCRRRGSKSIKRNSERRTAVIDNRLSKRDVRIAVASVSGTRNEDELEKKRKKQKSAEAMVNCWDNLLQEERNNKYQILQQRVRFQRELISKQDQLLVEARIQAEQERLERINSRRLAQREMNDGLRTHLQKIQEHKQRIAEKMQETFESDHVTQDDSTQRPSVTLNQQNPNLHVRSVEEDGASVTSSSEGSEKSWSKSRLGEGGGPGINVSAVPGSDGTGCDEGDNTGAAIMRLLGIEPGCNHGTVSIDAVWSGWRADAVRRLRPAVEHSNRLKTFASPSVQQCLEIYERPTAHDRYTGKPIPLSHILNEVKRMTVSREATQSIRNNTLHMVAKQTQRKAEMMLKRKDPYNFDAVTRGNPEWYIDKSLELEQVQDATIGGRKRSKSTTNTHGENLTSMIQSRRPKSGTSLKIKKQLPRYLAPDGDLVSGSLEEFGEELYYCAPSRKSVETKLGTEHAQNNLDVSAYDNHVTASSVFLTDLKQSDDNEHSHEIKNSAKNENVFITQKSGPSNSNPLSYGVESLRTPSRSLKSMGWQPLSCNALSEHTRVSEVPMKGEGHMAHGKYKMWKPLETYQTDTNH